MASGIKYTQPTSYEKYPFLQRLVQTSSQFVPTTNVMVNTDRFTVGSNSECSYVLNDMRISDVHAVLERGDGTWNVTNTGEGDVILNDKKLEKNDSAVLKDGDLLRFTEKDHIMRFVESGRPKIEHRPPTTDPGTTCCWIWSTNSDPCPCCPYCDCGCHCCDEDTSHDDSNCDCDCGDCDCDCGDCDCGNAGCGACCECLVCPCDVSL